MTSGGITAYFLNQASVRARSPEAPFASNSLFHRRCGLRQFQAARRRIGMADGFVTPDFAGRGARIRGGLDRGAISCITWYGSRTGRLLCGGGQAPEALGEGFVFLFDFGREALAEFVEEFGGGLLLFNPVGRIDAKEFFEILLGER